MMALVGMILFTAALGAVLHVVALTLCPALPRMAALLASTEPAATLVTSRLAATRLSSAGRARWVERPDTWALAA